ncbi:MAG: PIN domain-containing protein [Candidatus Aenigmarchaeota archaeon]|nr:PIN domain-containing protein [Candidatus Aenigmarchaeota archaeon]
MSKYVIDAYAWLEYFDGTPKGEDVKKLVENKENKIYTASITMAEIVSVIKRRDRDHEQALNTIPLLSKIFDIDKDICAESGSLHAEIKKEKKNFVLIDAFVLAIARKLKAKVVTGDPHFKNLKETVMI